MPRNMVCNGSTLALWPLHITQSSLATWGKVTSIVSVPEGRRGECHNILCGDATQVVFAEFSILALFCSPYLLVDHPDHDVRLYMSLFTISLFTGGIGLIQLSDKFRMDMKHAYITLLCGWLCWLFGSYVFIYLPSMAVAMIPIGVYWMFALSILLYNFCSEEFSINSSDSPFPA
ncbi:hypothetical protein DY000_02003903 [Brassica cretica]|uniref:Uncharacterized protein n=1 Tax=Brassica cretica TaxID=69181 RepID=A0ABQ7C6Y4_BRACR|nr:hypothetical protein DY000_02003903 [Brassica cretica]